MIQIDNGTIRFRYRVAGVAIHNHMVLLNRFSTAAFWFLPGGGVHLGEPASQTLAREMQEELGTSISVKRLLWTVESFFRDEQDERRSYHSLGLYLLMTFPSASPLYQHNRPFPGLEQDANLLFQWHQLTALPDLELYPRFLRTALQVLPEHPIHILDLDQ